MRSDRRYLPARVSEEIFPDRARVTGFNERAAAAVFNRSRACSRSDTSSRVGCVGTGNRSLAEGKSQLGVRARF
jgi:hypothetical protein